MKKLFLILMIISSNNYAQGIGFDMECDRVCLGLLGYSEKTCLSVCSYDPYITAPFSQECVNRCVMNEYTEGWCKDYCAGEMQ